MAGYNAHDASPYRLRGNARIKQRISEITRQIAVKTRVTVETISAELDEVRTRALAVDQLSAAQAAVVSKAKLHGLLIDRKETGAPGEFGALQTQQEVLALVTTMLGADVTALLSAALAQTAPALAAPDDAHQVAGQAADEADDGEAGNEESPKED